MKQDNGLVTNDKQAMAALKQHGGNIVTVILLVLAAFFGWQFYQKNYGRVDTVAADSYTAISNDSAALALAAQNPDAQASETTKEQLFSNIDSLVAKHGDTVYAWQALMTKARHQADSDDYAGAAVTLKAASEVPIDDEGLLAISRLQLAAVELAAGQADAALATINGTFPESFEATRLEVLGDIQVAKKDDAAAKAAYEKAWEILSGRQESRALLKLKMQSLGLEPADIERPAVVSEQAMTNLQGVDDEAMAEALAVAGVAAEAEPETTAKTTTEQ
ncbi:MAG: tetratricopeptide repeat protein [Moraxella sp.]|nr:tetratricopeptide repeat protein [Moraxella sp.]